MTYSQAFFLQARSAIEACQLLERESADLCQRLHFLQMATECTAKAIQARHLSKRPAFSHTAFTNAVLLIRLELVALRRSGDANAADSRFIRRVNSIIGFAQQVESLHPSVRARACNVEYPWEVHGIVLSPVKYRFSREFPRSKRLTLLTVLDSLLRRHGH
ncbi:MAG: hypothetical protein SFX74_07285 [Fimbriimonadaceae bacterium]|nr:hypothetical protein [Fimbriimonadaceae bacterium]